MLIIRYYHPCAHVRCEITASSEITASRLLNPNIQADEKRAYNVAYLLVYFYVA